MLPLSSRVGFVGGSCVGTAGVCCGTAGKLCGLAVVLSVCFCPVFCCGKKLDAGDILLLPLMTDLSFISCLGGKLLKFLGLSLSPSCLGLLDGSFILILATCL